MPLNRTVKGVASDHIAAEGYLAHDLEALSTCQRECIKRFGASIQGEHEQYISEHPEVIALLKKFVSEIANMSAFSLANGVKTTSEFFTRPLEDLDKDIREYLKLPKEGPYVDVNKKQYISNDLTLVDDLRDIMQKYYPETIWQLRSEIMSRSNTVSSSFISFATSDTTLPTPEPEPVPELTMPEIFALMVSNTIDKVIYTRFNDAAIIYDAAYVEVQRAVEEAMEIPVIEIREDIAVLLWQVWENFEEIIKEKERVAAVIAWEKRMRKKLKRSLRRMNNFKGYVTPPTPKSEVSTHESYLVPPQRPCQCQPQFHYNRYSKDRFGIYLPAEPKYQEGNITVTPIISEEDASQKDQEEKVEEDNQTKSKASSTLPP